MLVSTKPMEGSRIEGDEVRFRETEEEWDNLAEITAQFQGRSVFFICITYLSFFDTVKKVKTKQNTGIRMERRDNEIGRPFQVLLLII